MNVLWYLMSVWSYKHLTIFRSRKSTVLTSQCIYKGFSLKKNLTQNLEQPRIRNFKFRLVNGTNWKRFPETGSEKVPGSYSEKFPGSDSEPRKVTDFKPGTWKCSFNNLGRTSILVSVGRGVPPWNSFPKHFLPRVWTWVRIHKLFLFSNQNP